MVVNFVGARHQIFQHVGIMEGYDERCRADMQPVLTRASVFEFSIMREKRLREVNDDVLRDDISFREPLIKAMMELRRIGLKHFMLSSDVVAEGLSAAQLEAPITQNTSYDEKLSEKKREMRVIDMNDATSGGN